MRNARKGTAMDRPCLDCGVFQCEECADYTEHGACCCGLRIDYTGDEEYEDGELDE